MGRMILIPGVLAGAMLLCAVRGDARDDPAPPAKAKPADGGARPLLKQLNEETQSLYREVRAGVVRVQLPPPKWAGMPLAEKENPVHKWDAELDPSVKKRLEAEQENTRKGQYRKLTATVEKEEASEDNAGRGIDPKRGKSFNKANPATSTARSPGGWSVSNHGGDTIEFRPDGSSPGTLQIDAGGSLTSDGQIIARGGRVQINVVPGGSFTPNNIGLLLDDRGHVLVPICVEKESIDARGVPVMVGDGQMTTAHFVGSDRQMNITVLRLDKPMGMPVRMAKERPREGALTMFLAPNSGVGRLLIWTNELKDWGVVVNMNGGVYGFTRQGQFLSAAGCKPAIAQLIQNGNVHRATIGVAIAEVPLNDPARANDPALGTQPAVRVMEVAADSPAAAAGLHVGDLILHLNDQPVGDPSGFAAAMSQEATNASVSLLRNGREQRVIVELPKGR